VPSAFGFVLTFCGALGFVFFAFFFDNSVPAMDTRVFNLDKSVIRLIGVIASLALMIIGRIPTMVEIAVKPKRK
jgi:hypothetical protein